MSKEIAANDHSAVLLEQVETALTQRRALRIKGGGSKTFLPRDEQSASLNIGSHTGIVNYDPSELVVSVRAGTRMTDLIAVLEASNQMLPFEPPLFGPAATVGGMIATGLSGPRRPWAGSARDYVLGTRVITGLGKHLRFGGEVMKNVAGYDASRLMTGSYGCLGVLTEVSLKVLPIPRGQVTLKLEMDAHRALQSIRDWQHQGLPLSAACHDGTTLWIRLEGGTASVGQASQQLGGEQADSAFWTALREHQLPFFNDLRPLWRLSVPPNTPWGDLPGDVLLDWGGAQRWLKSDTPAAEIRTQAKRLGGSATCYTPRPGIETFHPLPEGLMRLHQRVKTQLDPQRIFNPGLL
ncbi:glycolate oxidase subunit GlcE [Pseudomonas sp. WN033]|nr:glycolate oxidase subunit GlcE [Pseudomonas sp. WN033]